MIKFLQGDCVEKIKELQDNSIDCVVTSPPYWGLRDYGVDGQLGLEKTYQEHIQNIVRLFKVIKPKLKDSATIWLNYGDSYASTVNGTKVKDMKKNLQKQRIKNKAKIDGVFDDRGFIDKPFSTIQGILKPKDLVMIPNRIAIALQEDGWWIRSEIIWHKPNPMPESTKDRPTNSHEKIWLITKNKKYYYDADAIKEDSIYAPNKTHEIERPKGYYKGKWSSPEKGSRHDGGFKAIREKRNKRNVWTITTKPFREAHFATFPKDLIEPCIKAGCPEKVCSECKTPYTKKPIYEYNTKVTNKNNNHGKYKNQETESTHRQGLHSKRGNKLIEVRDNLPNQKDFVKFLREKTTLNDLVENTDIEKTTIEHWFRNDEAGFAFPSVKDWNKIRPLVNDGTKEFNDIDNGLTCIQYKTDSVQSKEIINFKLEKSCDCKTNKFESGVVLDPFGGAGTTGIVAKSLNRQSILIELNPEYIKIAQKRFEEEFGLFND